MQGLAGKAAGLAVSAGEMAGIAGNYNLYRNPYAKRGVNLLGNFSSSSFHALQIDLNHRFGKNLQFQANYTFAKVLSDSANATVGDSAITKVEFLRSSVNPRLDYGPASFDIRHSLKVNFYYLLPVENLLTNPSAKAILGGWSVSSIIVRQSGTPFSIESNVPSADFLGFNSVLTTADLVGSAANLIDVRKTACGVYFVAASALIPNGNGCSTTVNQSVLANPGAGQVGTLQPRSFYNPWATEVNLGVQKTIVVRESQSIKIRVEAVNLFNNASWYIPDGGNGVNLNRGPDDHGLYQLNPGFGQIFSTLYPSRKMQFTFLYRF